jgi:exonuclease III
MHKLIINITPFAKLILYYKIKIIIMEEKIINIVCWNINYSFISNILKFIDTYKNPDIFMLQEGICNSRVKFNDCDKFNKINEQIKPYGYTLLYNVCERPKCSFLVKTTLLTHFTIIDNIGLTSELIKSRVIVGKINEIVLINIYAPCIKYRPYVEMETFINELNLYIKKITKIYGNNFILGGDLNTVLHDFEEQDYIPDKNVVKMCKKYKLVDIYKVYIGDKQLCELSQTIKSKVINPYGDIITGYVKIDYFLMNFIYPYLDNGVYEDTCGSDHRPLWLNIVININTLPLLRN